MDLAELYTDTTEMQDTFTKYPAGTKGDDIYETESRWLWWSKEQSLTNVKGKENQYQI